MTEQQTQRMQEIKARAENARGFVLKCDRTNWGCQVPQVIKLIDDDISWLIEQLESLQREQEERENPKPLTIDELGKLASSDPACGRHCFVKSLESGRVFHALVDIDSEGIVVMIGSNKKLLIEKYGELWIAYATEPKGEATCD